MSTSVHLKDPQQNNQITFNNSSIIFGCTTKNEIIDGFYNDTTCTYRKVLYADEA